MICVDASLAAKWFLAEEGSTRATALYEETVPAGIAIVAPSLLPIEMTNIFHQQTKSADGWTLEMASASLARFLSLSIAIHNPDGLHQRALALANAYKLPAAYDAHYLALAEYFGCELWTDDRRLSRGVQSNFPFVRRLSEYPTSAGT